MDLGKQQSAHPGNLSVSREIAVGIAATIVFYLSAMFIPMAGFVAGIFTSLPTLLAFYRWGSPIGYWIPGGVALLGTVLLTYLNMVQSIPYLLEMLFLGLFLGTGMRMHWSLERTIALAALLVFSTGVLALWLFTPISEGGLFNEMERDLREAVTLAVTQYGGHIQDKQGFEQALQQVVPTLVRLFPGMALASALAVAWLNVIVTARFCRMHSISLPPWPELSLWRSPEPLVWGLIASGFLCLFTSGQLRLIASNVLVVLGLIYFLHGLAVVSFYADRWRLPRIARAFIYAILFLQQFATLAIVLTGLFDMWMDFRRLHKKPDEED
jgi:uncharacterized protein YybS (DUF2232 family)